MSVEIVNFPTPPNRDRAERGGDTGNSGNGNPPGGDGVEARVARLESDVEYIKRDIGEIKSEMRQIGSDIGAIKVLLGTFGGGLTVAVAVFAWVANNRFDAIMEMLAK